jgi:hypothetical protein
MIVYLRSTYDAGNFLTSRLTTKFYRRPLLHVFSCNFKYIYFLKKWVRCMCLGVVPSVVSCDDGYELSGSVKTVRLLNEWSWLTFQKVLFSNELVHLPRQVHVSAKSI